MTVFAAFAALSTSLRAAHQLVVICDLPDAGRLQWRAELRALGLADDDVVLTGHVDDATLDALYAQAALFVFSSRYEGFGLPPLEAMAHGTPVVTSRASSLPEIAGEAALYVDPYDVDDIATAVKTITADAGLRAELSHRGRAQVGLFSVARYRERVAALYERLG